MSRRGASGDNLGGQRQARDERNAYARAKVKFAEVQAAQALGGVAAIIALAAIGPYRSRGKGRGTPSRRYGNQAGAYSPHQGQQERMRRVIGGWARQKQTKTEVLAMMRVARPRPHIFNRR